MTVLVIIEDGYSFHKIDIYHPLIFLGILSLKISYYGGTEKKSRIMYTKRDHD